MSTTDLLHMLLHMLRRLPGAEHWLDLIRQGLELFDWQTFGEGIGHGFWDVGGPLPGRTELEQAAYALRHAEHVFVFLGSGFSVDSGIASFRLDNDDMPAIYQHIEPYQMTHTDTFKDHPAAQLAWHQAWREVMHQAKPHEGQRAMWRIVGMTPGRYTFVTQNVDDLLERAAIQEDVEECHAWHLHGSLEQVRCHDCQQPLQAEVIPSYEHLPACVHCGGRLRPDVVWFGESPPQAALHAARRAAQRAEVCLIIGTSALVHPAAELPMIALRAGARLIEINPHESLLTEHSDVHLVMGAREALMALEDELQKGS